MSIKTFNTTNCSTQNRRGTPSIRFARQGQVSINKYTIEALKLKLTDTVQFHQEEEDPLNWFISIGGKEGFPLRSTNKESLCYAFNNANLCNQVNDALNSDMNGTSIALRVITDDPVNQKNIKMYPLVKTVVSEE